MKRSNIYRAALATVVVLAGSAATWGSRAALSAQAVQTKARSADYLGQRDLAQVASAVCPQCGAKTQGGKFCPECGAGLSRHCLACTGRTREGN